MSSVSLPGSVAEVAAVGTPKGHVPGISSLKGEFEKDPPMAIAANAKKPRNAGRLANQTGPQVPESQSALVGHGGRRLRLHRSPNGPEMRSTRPARGHVLGG